MFAIYCWRVNCVTQPKTAHKTMLRVYGMITKANPSKMKQDIIRSTAFNKFMLSYKKIILKQLLFN